MTADEARNKAVLHLGESETCGDDEALAGREIARAQVWATLAVSLEMEFMR